MTLTPHQADSNDYGAPRKTRGQKLCVGLALLALAVGTGMLMLSCCPLRRRMPTVPPLPPVPAVIEQPAAVKVLIRSLPELSVDCSGGTWLTRGQKPVDIVASGAGPWRIGVADAKLTIDGRAVPVTAMTLHPFKDRFELERRAYRGRLLVEAAGDHVDAVNLVEPELYLRSVVGSEMYSKWPMNALMAQAVAARTYMLYTQATKGYLTLVDMAYKGIPAESRPTDLAVELTEGVVLTYEGRLFPTYFHSTCGGHTVAVERVFEDEPIVPLSGTLCEWCRSSPAYQWRAEIPARRIVESIKRPEVPAIGSIVPLDTEPDGYARSVLINGKVRMAANAFRLAVGPNVLKSTRFSAARRGNELVFEGRGWGHGVGLCQWGSYGLAREGYDWQEILEYYYPTASLQILF